MDISGALTGLQEFLERGGPILTWIMALTFVMWAFILERMAYFGFAHKGAADRARQEWGARSDHHTWNAHAIRDQLISEVKAKADQNVELIKTLVAVAPLFGLLGTVTGMISVVDLRFVRCSRHVGGGGSRHHPDHGGHGRFLVRTAFLQPDRAHGQTEGP